MYVEVEDHRIGDYHNHINSEMYLNWVRKKFILNFELLHPNIWMILVMDNAVYQPKREIGTPLSCTKPPELLEMYDTYNIPAY